MKRGKTPEVCPVCGEDVPPKAKACPECGACHESGWGEDADTSGDAGITGHGYGEEEEFDYDEWLAREEGRAKPPGQMRSLWKWVAVVLLALILFIMWKCRTIAWF
jgi:hypothetical protein